MSGGRRRPFKRVVERPKKAEAEGVFYGAKGQIVSYTDKLVCGHEYPSVIPAPPDSRTPYRKLPDGTFLRRCNACPLEAAPA